MAMMPSMSALSVEMLSEHDLIEAARDGDHRAFEELYARYQGAHHRLHPLAGA